MARDCPVCRRPVPFRRSIRTSVWGSWRCPDCDSLLGVDRNRRFLALIPWTIVVILLMVFQIMRYGPVVTISILAPFFFVCFYFFERTAVLERVGFRCTKCGYDLQGQVEPHCPECGYELNADDRAVLARIRSGDVVAEDGLRQHVRGRWGKGGIIFLIVVLLMLVGTLSGLFLMYRTKFWAWSVSLETKLLVSSVLNYTRNHNGLEPSYALEHVREDILTTSVLVLPNSATSLQGVQMDGVSLSQFDDLNEEGQTRWIEAARMKLPKDVVAHRLGDFVFTYHGIDLPVATSANSLWLVIGVRDPDQNLPPPTSAMIPVGVADGSVILVPRADWSARLAAQNTLRRAHGLPALSDPLMVTHDQPAVEGADSLERADDSGE